MKVREQLEREDARYMRLLRGGNRPLQIARKCKVCVRTVYNGIARERDREAERKRTEAPADRGPKLTPAYGSSCKPYAMLRCSDVHGPDGMPHGSSCVCGVCDRSGLDHVPLLRESAARIALRPGDLTARERSTRATRPAPAHASRKQKRAARRSTAA